MRARTIPFEDRGEMLSLGIGEATLTGMGITLAAPWPSNSPSDLPLACRVVSRARRCLAAGSLKQAHLAGRTRGLRDSIVGWID